MKRVTLFILRILKSFKIKRKIMDKICFKSNNTNSKSISTIRTRETFKIVTCTKIPQILKKWRKFFKS